MKKILVCEDEAAIRDFVVINLTRAGYDVVEADCGETALKKYDDSDGDFDIAILDVMMPGIDGFQVCTKPLAALRRADELVRQTGVLQDGMNLLVGEVFKYLCSVAKGSVADGELGVQQLVFDASRLGLLVDACAGRVVQRLAVRRELVGHKR